MEKLIVILWILFGFYLLILVAILADLWSGITKARKSGVIRSSYGFRRTVEKMGRYYNVMVILTIVDAFHISAIWYFETYYEKSYFLFPFITMLGAIGLCLIEVKSIYEKAEDKVRIDDVGRLAGKMLASKDDLKEVVAEVVNYMQTPAADTKTVVTMETTTTTTEVKKDQQ